MCGRYASDIAIDDLMAFFDAKPGTAYDWAGRYSIAPSTRAPIVREWLDEGELHRDVNEARWGLRPGWAKESGSGRSTPAWRRPRRTACSARRLPPSAAWFR